MPLEIKIIFYLISTGHELYLIVFTVLNIGHQQLSYIFLITKFLFLLL